MLIVDPDPAWAASIPTAISNAIDGRNDLNLSGPAARNAALYFPCVRQVDPLRDSRVDTFVPSGIIAGIIARTDVARGVWKAPAGLDAALNGVQDLQVNLNDLENGQLNPLGHQLPALLRGQRPRRLGRAHAARRRRKRRRIQVPAGAPAGAVPRREPLPRHAVGGVRAQRRAAVGADAAQRRRLHAGPVPPGRVPGRDAARRLLRQMRQPDHDPERHQPRHREHHRRLRAAQAGRVRRDPRSSRWLARSPPDP